VVVGIRIKMHAHGHDAAMRTTIPIEDAPHRDPKRPRRREPLDA